MIRTPGSPSLIKRGANGVWRYRLPGEPEDGTPAPEDLLNAMAYSELRQPPQDQPPKDDLSGAEPPQQQQQPGGQDARGAEAPQWQLEAVPSEGLASVPSAAGREDSMLSVSQAMMQRSFNEDDPFQVRACATGTSAALPLGLVDACLARVRRLRVWGGGGQAHASRTPSKGTASSCPIAPDSSWTRALPHWPSSRVCPAHRCLRSRSPC